MEHIMRAVPPSSFPWRCLRFLDVARVKNCFSPLSGALDDAARGRSLLSKQELRVSQLHVGKQVVPPFPSLVGLGALSALVPSRFSSSAERTHLCSSRIACFCSSCSAFLFAASAPAVSESTSRSPPGFTSGGSSPSNSSSSSSHSSFGEKPVSAEKNPVAGGSAKSGSASPAAVSSPAKRVTGLHKLCDLKGPLASFMGKSEASRIEVIKHVWDHIKRHNLQSAENKKMINADHALKPILQKDQVSMFEMNKLLSKYVQSRPITSADATRRDC